MADAYTTLNNLTKPEYNADEDTWGGLLNANMDTIDPQITGAIYGLDLTTSSTPSATIGISAGGASGMVLASDYTKTTSAWSLGTGGGGLDSGTIAANTWYHFWLIQRVDTGVVDIIFSTNTSTPTLPANYTRKRIIGSRLTDASSKWGHTIQRGDDQYLYTPVNNNNGTVGEGTATLRTVSTPLGRSVEAILSLGMLWGSSGGQWGKFYSPYCTSGHNMHVDPASTWAFSEARIVTDTSSRIYVDIGAPAGSANYYIKTLGWVDPRGKW